MYQKHLEIGSDIWMSRCMENDVIFYYIWTNLAYISDQFNL